MANLSQLRRQRMLAFLEKMREQHKDDDEVLVAINEVENEINEKKYGLVWEEHSEEVEERMADEVPIFVEDPDKEITMTDNGYNFLLEGDNLHSLHLLEKTHKEKIDVIYIDPPYNTGNGDFIYNDSIVDENDAFRHSKWLSFMAKRLRIAWRLLSENGIIFISIDDHEQGNLAQLCDTIFGEDSHVTTMVWQRKTGASDAKGLATITEYILVYTKNKDKKSWSNIFTENNGSFDRNRYRFSDEYESERGMYYTDSLDRGGLRYSDSLNYAIECPDGTKTFPNGRTEFVNDGWTWKWGEEKVKWGLENGFITFKKSKNKPSGWTVQYKNYMFVDNEGNPVNRTAPFKNLILDILNANGVNEQKAIFGGKVFNNPKPVELIKFLLHLSKTNNITLDFFAGSGTTGQAVLELNKEDGGNRKFILCTNNENNICNDVTYPRLKTVITGIRLDGSKYSDGIPADLKYYHTDYVPKNSGALAQDLISHIDEMIQLEYGVKIDREKYISILTDEDADGLEKNWQNFPNIRAIYVSRSVLLTGKQRELFETKDCFVIPDYYFREELRDAGEA